MPHVIVKLWPGQSEQQKAQLADAITKDVMDVFGLGEESISVSMEESNHAIELRRSTSRTSRTSRSSFTRSPDTTRLTCHERRVSYGQAPEVRSRD